MGGDDASGVELHTKATAGMEKSLRGLFSIATAVLLTTTYQAPQRLPKNRGYTGTVAVVRSALPA